LIKNLNVWWTSPDVSYAKNKGGKIAKKTVTAFFIALLLSGISFIILSPIVNLLSKSFMDIRDFYNPLVYLFPKTFSLYNYRAAIEFLDYSSALTFTFLFVLGITVIQAFICSLVGYGFARFRFPYKNVLFSFVILTIVIPPQTFMVRMYMQFRYFDMFGLASLIRGEPLNLLNTPFPILILTVFGMGLRSGLYIYLFRQFFRGLPKEIEEAAIIDGASRLYTYFKVMLPNAVPSIITVMLFSFVWQFNDTFYSSTFMMRYNFISMKLSSVAVNFSESFGVVRVDPNLATLVTYASVLLVIAPIILIYLLLQKYFIEGIERSGIVG
jgi:multiple sugar transport system permease protein